MDTAATEGTAALAIVAAVMDVVVTVAAAVAVVIDLACFLFDLSPNFFMDGEGWFLQGVSRFVVCFWMVICGEVVVICVVEPVELMVTFQRKERATFFNFIFLHSQFGNYASVFRGFLAK